jgi:hypothetical protein
MVCDAKRTGFHKNFAANVKENLKVALGGESTTRQKSGRLAARRIAKKAAICMTAFS